MSEFLAGQVVTADMLNAIFATRAAYTRSASQSIPHNATTLAVWTVTQIEVGGLALNVAQDAVTVTRPGMYLIVANIEYATNSSGVRITRILVNGSRVGVGNNDAPSTLQGGMSVAALVPLDEGDEVSVQLFQTSGGNLNTNVAGQIPHLGIARVA